ncbi:MAG TPA: alpha/beta hydrolase-fold protein [Candidatus Ozemobacteraceae bacterium]|nr:alpha/beta hydrolase-fold protein [Candidatus Ozemobacteraceae bacterium]
MNREYHVIPSQTLGHPLEMLIFGHSGKPVLVFPSSEGRFFDYENFGMIGTIAPFIDSGKIQVFCIDGIDSESWYAPVPPADKARRANDYDYAIIHEVIPHIRQHTVPHAGIMTHGVSFGAYHAANFYLRHPDVFDSCIALSGNYSIAFAVGAFCNSDVYFNDPLMYLPNLHEDKILSQLREDLLLICCGQGPWEDWLGEARAVSHHLHTKNVPHVLDLWGYDVGHDWPWWKKQILHFLGKLERAGCLRSDHRFHREQVESFVREFHHL